MNQSRATLRYAKAVLDFALEQKAAYAVENDMRHIANTISQNQELQDFLKNPVVPAAIKKEALQEIFNTSHEISKNLIAVLTDNKRIALLQEVAHKYSILYKKQKGEAVAYVTTAVPLTPDLEAKIKAEVTKGAADNIAMQNTVDKTILGGFVLQIGDLQYDASIASNLNRLKKNLQTAYT